MSAKITVKEYSVSTLPEAKAVVSKIRGRDKNDLEVVNAVESIITEIENSGDEALLKFTKRFDSPAIEKSQQLRVSNEELRSAYSGLNRRQIDSMKTAITQISKLASRQMERFSERTFGTPLGFSVNERYVPFRRIGGYVPGGLASYPSTVLMICATAKEAGVKEVVLATPPRRDGSVNDAVIVAADLCGVKDTFKMGGAQAIAALALGTETIEKVDLIAGPGNQYVTEAKRVLASRGKVMIDTLAGPTELLIVADRSANPKFVSEDIISQAEHGNKTICGLVSNSRSLIEKVVARLKNVSNRPRLKQILESTLFVALVPDINLAVQFAELLSPEHTEVMVKNSSIATRISNSGLVLTGDFVPCSSTDYIVGTNHVLPTGASARVSSGLGASNFLKRVTVVSGPKSSLKRASQDITILSDMEGLTNHGQAATARFREVS